MIAGHGRHRRMSHGEMRFDFVERAGEG